MSKQNPTKTRWTKDQQNAIDARRGSLVVSAAAGSGKTTVLVERILQRLMDSDHPCNADELLIVTFTRAATAEMRSKLSQKVNAALQEHPEDENLQRQQMLIPSAPIYTIDAFCSTLVREHFELLGLAPDFRPLDENEGKLLQQEAMETVLGNFYKEEDPNFITLVEQVYAGRDDTSLEKEILKLYRYSRAYPDPKGWLQEGLRLYDHSTSLEESPAYFVMKQNGLEQMEYVESLLHRAEALLEQVPQIEETTLLNVISQDVKQVQYLKELLNDNQLTALQTALQNTSFEKWNGKKVKDAPEVGTAKALRDSAKKEVQDRLSKLFFFDEALYREDCEELQPVVQKLVDVVNQFDQEFSRLKTEGNVLDFSDIELYALQLLVEDPSKRPFKRTPLAEELGSRFQEILIDEYQDTNLLQDTIFAAISKEEQNLFLVGDVKQSIYRFRQAMPKVFLNRKKDLPLYDPAKDAYPANIILGQNFRSRKGVTELVNFVCERIMSPAVGDIDYNEHEKLVFAADYYGPMTEPECSLHLLRDTDETDRLEKEAQYLAGLIQKQIQDTKGDEKPYTYKDFSILLQTTKGKANVYERVLLENGIPVYSDAGGSLLNTSDVQIVLSFLKIIDNPLQDIPLISVLMSPLFGFTEDDIASLRIRQRKGFLYAALLKSEKEGEAKSILFLELLRHFRRLAISLPAGELIRQIYEETAFLPLAGALPNGAQRVANLRQLIQYAEDYDSHSFYGISGFIRYLSRIEENELDQQTSSAIAPNANVVHITSIHKSKGLQYRVCILANLAGQFNDRDLNDGVILHPSLGIGMKGRDLETGNTYPTLQHTAIREETKRSSRSESLRVLYVALTRAQEKLVLVGSLKNPEDHLMKLAQELGEGRCDPYLVKSKNNLLDWLLLALLQHPSALPLRNCCDTQVPVVATDFSMDVYLEASETATEKTTPSEEEAVPDENMLHALLDRFNYQYPYAALSTTVTKRAASSIKEDYFSTDFFANSRPEFLSQKGLTPSQRGTCQHKFMQFADFPRAKKNPAEELERLVSEGFLNTQEAAVIDTQKVSNFFASKLYQRIEVSPKLMREKKFAVLKPAGLFDPTLPSPLSEENVLIQGIVDCAFEEDGALIVLDYKTDRVKEPETLVALYQDQIQTYCQALETCTGMPVKEAYLYSFALDREIPVPIDQ